MLPSDLPPTSLLMNSTFLSPFSSDAVRSPFDDVNSAVLLDGIFQSFILGFVLGQASKYFSAYKEDHWKKRALVGIVVFLSVCVSRDSSSLNARLIASPEYRQSSKNSSSGRYQSKECLGSVKWISTRQSRVYVTQALVLV